MPSAFLEYLDLPLFKIPPYTGRREIFLQMKQECIADDAGYGFPSSRLLCRSVEEPLQRNELHDIREQHLRCGEDFIRVNQAGPQG